MAKPPIFAGESTTMQRPSHDPSLAPAATYRLSVVDGPDRGATLVISGDEPMPLYLGQGPACALRLTDRLASRRHLALDLVDKKLRLIDAGSTNGTLVNGVRIVDAWLAGGETLELGDTKIKVELVDAATAVPISEETGFGRVRGASTEIRRFYPLFARIAASDVAVLIEGETGTGKEVLAESIHQESPRADGPFIVFDCASVAPTLLESDLFGHERGAFTGAMSARKGVFEQAHGGTLLIDEIGELEPQLQPKLLRVLERSEVRRVGGERPIKVDVRILAATRRDLDREVQAGRFRDDLYHRIAVARVELPPLRRRRGDIALLARTFAKDIVGRDERFPDDLLRRWEDYAWPGNVRELRNAVSRWLALGELHTSPLASPAHSLDPAPADLDAPPANDLVARLVAERLPYTHARARVLEDFEQRYVEAVLADHGGNVARAAAASGIARRHFQRVKARSQK